MSIAYLLVALGLGVFALAAWALFWAIDSGQYDDVDKHAAAALEEREPDHG
jgi:cbb3-type cytochrome oxidase maturation protein